MIPNHSVFTTAYKPMPIMLFIISISLQSLGLDPAVWVIKVKQTLSVKSTLY